MSRPLQGGDSERFDFASGHPPPEVNVKLQWGGGQKSTHQQDEVLGAAMRSTEEEALGKLHEQIHVLEIHQKKDAMEMGLLRADLEAKNAELFVNEADIKVKNILLRELETELSSKCLLVESLGADLEEMSASLEEAQLEILTLNNSLAFYKAAEDSRKLGMLVGRTESGVSIRCSASDVSDVSRTVSPLQAADDRNSRKLGVSIGRTESGASIRRTESGASIRRSTSVVSDVSKAVYIHICVCYVYVYMCICIYVYICKYIYIYTCI